MTTCRNCGKPIKFFNNYRGERDWTHEDQMIGMWCRLKAAEPQIIHHLKDGAELTSCCGRTESELPGEDLVTSGARRANCGDW